MIRLYGSRVSNYTNMVELFLLEKNVPFEFVETFRDQSPAFLAKSPHGKVPCIETADGFIFETNVILEYLEETHPNPPLLPADPGRRAQVRAQMKIMELYIDLPARLCLAEAFFGRTMPEAIREQSRQDLAAGFATLKRAGRFAPYVAGGQKTLADIMFFYTVSLASRIGRIVHGLDLLSDFDSAHSLLERLGANPNVQAIEARRQLALPAFVGAMTAKPA